jgi:hypothetical protein
MRPALLPLVLLAAVACRPSTSHEASAPPSQAQAPVVAGPAPTGEKAPPVPRIDVDARQSECVDKWLKGHELDQYGNPQGTMYAGGTPTFDETTGRSVDRWTLVAKNRPEALQSCAVPLPP